MKTAFFEADVIPGGCPGLVPLSTLCRMRSIIACGALSNGNGLLQLTIRAKSGMKYTTCQELFLTDSGHYLLRVDRFGELQDKSHKDLGRLVRKCVVSNVPSHLKESLTLMTTANDNDNANGNGDNDDVSNGIFVISSSDTVPSPEKVFR